MTRYEFTDDASIVASIPGLFSISDLEKEHGVYSATPAFVLGHCGPITKLILAAVPDTFYAEAERLKLYPNCDVRIHRLYPGDYPAYPGWHCDGEYRETYFSQPDLDKVPVSNHLTCHVSTHLEGVCNTEFLTEPFSCDVEPTSQEVTLWGQVHRKLEEKRTRETFQTQDGEMVWFGARTLHRCMPAKVRGWRLFFRMSMWHRPNLGEGGMITKQEQVYRLSEGGGW